MHILISPAKNLDFETTAVTKKFSQPQFIEKAEELVGVCRKLSASKLTELMGISEKLAQLNVERFAEWDPEVSLTSGKQAVLAFNGDVYVGLDANSMKAKQLNYAQKHLRILSGLYGILCPLDLIRPYRLEMGSKLKNSKGTTLYDYWGEDITKNIANSMKKEKDDVLVNLASGEYFKSVNEKLICYPVVTPVFKDFKNGAYKIISFFAKKARGTMARYIIENQLKKVSQLEGFSVSGYRYSRKESEPLKPVFLRRPTD
ncbi:MAG: peroxide stress protein YaaA [Candidatus Latescibacterota bacterium]|nr:peroxide stress protein YaaA [Candidatus Latescibacterota bacterium]